ncbi:hypothetical protein TraAM80_09380 [Trypanosoma rangeli]|uniref:Uncharacterized protein n=1 Tax=Trypanosoma rangeli TaxID=5698 RepID=A0A3R7R847_TRYRA|nr:uncharacterized protein TraAM80_09380 [Trypanosoma rangeli]RNE97594.1 hypothetical protein TraAM80_09380 [Trypanosoma rangeli]|eukprot:RNE97594.1 hypothetical protein TraAM80_09380 [Trypanosoma rangeli]
MLDGVSNHSSSDISVRPVYLLEGSPREPIHEKALVREGSSVFLTARSDVDLSVTPNDPFAVKEDGAEISMGAQEGNEQCPGLLSTIQNKATTAISFAAGSAFRLLETLLEPQAEKENPSQDAYLLQVVQGEDRCEPFDTANYITRLNAEDLSDEEEEEEEDEEFGITRIEIDLVSTLRAYRKNPSDCFGHLVLAALSSRSEEHPVTCEELKEARLNPYLVCMIIKSGALDVSDECVHAEIQRCVDTVIPSEADRVSLSVYEYLLSLLKLDFVRLSSEQYALMKDSGFEFLKLLCENPHVLPPGRLNSVRLNYVQSTWCVDVFTMILNMSLELFCVISIVLVIKYRIGTKRGASESTFGYYTALVYGIGYAAHLIGMIFVMRGKVRHVVYGKMLCPFPSPHLLVVPVIPLYNMVSIFTYVRHRKGQQNRNCVAILHDIVAAQLLSSLCFSLCVAMPQIIYQSFVLADIGTLIRYDPQHYSHWLLTVSAISTTWVCILRMFRALATYDSINCFGFACFGFQGGRIIEPHSAIVRMVHISCLFLFELNISFLVMGAMSVVSCKKESIVTMALAGASLLVLLVLLILLLLSRESVFRLMWALLPLTLLQISIFIYQNREVGFFCRYLEVLNGSLSLFRFLIWAVFSFFMTLWVVQVVVLFVARKLRGASR